MFRLLKVIGLLAVAFFALGVLSNRTSVVPRVPWASCVAEITGDDERTDPPR